MKLRVEFKKETQAEGLPLFTFIYSEGPITGNFGQYRRFTTRRKSIKNAESDFLADLTKEWGRRVISHSVAAPITSANKIAVLEALLADRLEVKGVQ